LETVSARGPFAVLDAFDAFEPGFLDAGRAGDRLAAARRCFGMQC
jgi:hypothetical protein